MNDAICKPKRYKWSDAGESFLQFFFRFAPWSVEDASNAQVTHYHGDDDSRVWFNQLASSFSTSSKKMD